MAQGSEQRAARRVTWAGVRAVRAVGSHPPLHTTGQMIPRPGPGNPRLLRRPNRIGLGRPCTGLPCLPGTFVRPPPRPAGGGPVDPARPSVDRAAAGGISCACECDPGRPRPAADLDVPVPVRDPSSCMHNDKAETFGCKSCSAVLYASSRQENGMCALERPGKLRSSISCFSPYVSPLQI